MNEKSEDKQNFMMIEGLTESVGIEEESVFEKEVWNRAIEAAAVKVNEEMGSDEVDTYWIEREIRKLKK